MTFRVFQSVKSGYTCVEFYNTTTEERQDMYTWIDANLKYNDKHLGRSTLDEILVENNGFFDARLKDKDMILFLLKWS